MKIKLLSLILAFGGLAFGQSLSIERIDTTHCRESNANLANELIAYLDVKNNSGNTIDVLAKRIDKGYNGLTDSNAICWGGQCWTPSTSVSPFSAPLAAGQTSNPADFSAHVYPDGDGLCLAGPITYVFFDANNPSDSVAYTINYKVGTCVSLKEETFSNFSLYPNPATNELNIKYSGMKGEEVSFELVNMIGTKVYTREFSEVADHIRLDISNLARGVYFYIIKSDGIVTSSKKMVIK